MEERGFAVIAGAVMIALALFMGFGAAVVVAQSNLIHSAKIAQELIATRAHEDLRLTVIDETHINIRNIGSTPSVVVALLVEKRDSFSVYSIPTVYIGILDSSGPHNIPIPVNKGDNVGMLTSLGNVFWEEVDD